MRAWERLLHDLVRAHREAPLVSRIARWDDLSRGLTDLPPGRRADQGHSLRPSGYHRFIPPSGEPDSHIVSDLLASSARSAADLDKVALVVTPADHQSLEVVGFHPFLTSNQLSDVLGSGTATVRRRLNRLVELSLIRHPGTDEIGEDASEELVELTARGLRLVAARLGLSWP
jgi:DNA-binding MarR family transcriptional regulator